VQCCAGEYLPSFEWFGRRERVQIGVGEPFMTRGVAGSAGSIVAVVGY
jgi:hypothetical protein